MRVYAWLFVLKIHSYELPHSIKLIKNKNSMRCIGEFGREILSRPVLVMKTVSPEAAFRYIVNSTLISNPDLRPVLAIAQG
jgi:hypothetical protein